MLGAKNLEDTFGLEDTKSVLPGHPTQSPDYPLQTQDRIHATPCSIMEQILPAPDETRMPSSPGSRPPRCLSIGAAFRRLVPGPGDQFAQVFRVRGIGA